LTDESEQQRFKSTCYALTTAAEVLRANGGSVADGCKEGGGVSATLAPYQPDSGRYYTVAGRFDSSQRLLDLGEKGVYPSCTPG